MKKHLLSSLLLSLVFCLPLWAQDLTVSGRITAVEDGSPLPGVNVIVKGTTKGTTSSADGTYQITVGKGTVLQFSFIGFLNQSVTIDTKTRVDVAMKSDVSQLQEIVVTAQGIRKNQREIGYAYSNVTTDDVTVGRSPQLAQALSGKVTGLAVL